MPKHLSKRVKEDKSSESESDTENSTKLNESSDEEIELDSDESKLKMLKNLKYDFASYEIKYIYETYLKNPDELELSPSYQREFAWSNDKQDLFIDSVVNNYIIPPIILIKLNNKKGYRYECMDGQHRLTVLKHYIEGKPINVHAPHNIRYLRKEDDKMIDVYYTQTEELDKSPKNHRYMTDDEFTAFNDKKLIVIKISNFDKKMDDVFDKIKNEMFLRLQKGERVSTTDMIRNHDNPVINTLREYNLMKYKTYETHETFKKIGNVLDVKAKKSAARLTNYIYFVLRSLIILKENKLDVGNIGDNILRDELLNKKELDKFNFEKDKCIEYIDKFKKFITRVYKMKEMNELPKMNEFFMLCLLKLYIDEKDNLNLALENYDKIKEINSQQYFNKIFNKTINGKSVKLIQGKYLEKPFEFIKENIVNSESESES
jgi:hypothetical protein